MQPQMNLSFILLTLVLATQATKLCQMLRLLPTKPLQKDIFRGMVLKTYATKMCFFQIIAKSVGYISFRVKFSNHLSSQNLTFCPLPRWN
jgi:hypothetical protein